MTSASKWHIIINRGCCDNSMPYTVGQCFNSCYSAFTRTLWILVLVSCVVTCPEKRWVAFWIKMTAWWYLCSANYALKQQIAFWMDIAAWRQLRSALCAQIWWVVVWIETTASRYSSRATCAQIWQVVVWIKTAASMHLRSVACATCNYVFVRHLRAALPCGKWCFGGDNIYNQALRRMRDTPGVVRLCEW